MYKMTQVKLWLEISPFTREIFVRFDPDNKHGVTSIIKEIDRIIYNKCFTYNSYTGVINDGETREFIIQALWELQKSWLPEGYKLIGSVEILDYIRILNTSKVTCEFGCCHEHITAFYNKESRIITLTKFDKEEDV